MSDSVIAAERFLGEQPGGVPVAITLRIHAPVRVGAAEWRCVVELDGLLTEPAPIAGGDPVQCLCLALGFVATELRSLVRRGGRLRFADGSATDVPLDAYFGPFVEVDPPAA